MTIDDYNFKWLESLETSKGGAIAKILAIDSSLVLSLLEININQTL